MEHAGQDHSAHARPPAASIAELRHPEHGSYEGHLVPGIMFIVWSSYWIWSIIDIQLRSRAAGHTHAAALPQHTGASRPGSSACKAPGSSSSSSSSRRQQCGTGRDEPFRSRAWYPWPFWPARHLEPIFKVTLPLLGVLIELYIGIHAWRPLYEPDGHFTTFHANNWQHALMYAAVSVSGVVDLIGYYTPLPAGTEKAFLALSFLVETLLMGMHAKPNPLDQLVHVLLTWVMIACVVVCAAEIAAPRSLLLAVLRGMLVMFQGTWFWHVGSIMFRDHMAWDMDDMAAVMFVPIVFCLHMLLICLGTLSAYLFLRWLYARTGITASPGGGGGGGGAKPLHHHDSDAATEASALLGPQTQLELSDAHVAHATGVAGGDTRVRDVARAKGTHLA